MPSLILCLCGPMWSAHTQSRYADYRRDPQRPSPHGPGPDVAEGSDPSAGHQVPRDGGQSGGTAGQCSGPSPGLIVLKMNNNISCCDHHANE